MSYTPTNWANLPATTSPVIDDNLQNIEDELVKLDNVIGVDDYDNTATYNVGDFCVYNKLLYRCISAITIAEDFNSSHWELKDIENYLKRFENTLKPSVLYNGSTTGTVILNDNASNYTYIEIYYTYNNFKGYLKLLGTTQVAILSGINFASNEYIQIFEEIINISGTTISRNTAHGKNISNTNNTIGSWSGSLNIIQVVGYKAS